MVLGDKSTLGFSLQDVPSMLTDMPEEQFQKLIYKAMGGLVMRITAKPENARLWDAVREVAKELLSAVNKGYLGGACRIASVSVGKTLIAMERQLSRLIELSSASEMSALLNDDMEGWSPTMSRLVLDGWLLTSGRRYQGLKPDRVVAVWEAIRLWICVGGYEVRPPFGLGVMQGMPLGPDSAFHARIMHVSVIILERLGLFSTESGDRARWSVYIDDGT